MCSFLGLVPMRMEGWGQERVPRGLAGVRSGLRRTCWEGRADRGLCLQEQRLKFLKQQDERQQQQAAEQEKLKRLKEIAESQEAKLKKVRALRGHVEQKRLKNGRLGEWSLGAAGVGEGAGRGLATGVARGESGTGPCAQGPQSCWKAEFPAAWTPVNRS